MSGGIPANTFAVPTTLAVAAAPILVTLTAHVLEVDNTTSPTSFAWTPTWIEAMTKALASLHHFELSNERSNLTWMCSPEPIMPTHGFTKTPTYRMWRAA